MSTRDESVVEEITEHGQDSTDSDGDAQRRNALDDPSDDSDDSNDSVTDAPKD